MLGSPLAPPPAPLPPPLPVPNPNMQLKHERLPSACATLQVFEEMKTVRNVKPTATTYGCLLKVCELRHDVDTAFRLYEEAFEVGVLATDECHNMLIDVCSDAGRWAHQACTMVALAHCAHAGVKKEHQPDGAPACVMILPSNSEGVLQQMPSLCGLAYWTHVCEASNMWLLL